MNKRNLQGLLDEFESAGRSVVALRESLGRAQEAQARNGIRIAIREALRAHRKTGFELMDAMRAEIDDARDGEGRAAA